MKLPGLKRCRYHLVFSRQLPFLFRFYRCEVEEER